MMAFYLLTACFITSAAACATGHSDVQARAGRTQLQSAMHAKVEDRDQRDQQSRLLASSVDHAELERMDRDSVRGLFGPGKPCTVDVCERNGFQASDWYYEIGVTENEQVKQLPLLLLAFDPHQQVKRVFAFTTH